MTQCQLKLGVNIDHVATLRQVRGVDYPDIEEAALACLRAGADQITVHLREDRRHIQDGDVYRLSRVIRHLNLEMANVPEIRAIALDILPAEVCMVPEKRHELTTEGGLDVAGGGRDLRQAVKELKDAGISVRLFIDPDERQVDAAVKVGAPCVELHTGRYCDACGDAADKELLRLQDAASAAYAAGLQVNAGHGINLDNIAGILHVPCLDTLNIGHSIIARAVFTGLESSVSEMISRMKTYSWTR